MSFGRNPHEAKAEAAEQKARCAKDDAARARCWRDAAHQWDRAAERERDEKRQRQFADRATAARASADHPGSDADARAAGITPATDPRSLN